MSGLEARTKFTEFKHRTEPIPHAELEQFLALDKGRYMYFYLERV
jgi:hypothetical protein